jgi:tRNA uridine 5-carboxymethylaminomethyl modification enzyme
VENYLTDFLLLTWDVQLQGTAYDSGLENARIFRPGYAIEYDYFELPS